MPARLFGLIPAAGQGARLGADAPKQYLGILGKPMLAHAVRALLAHSAVEVAFVVLDGFQGKGIGGELLSYLTLLARKQGLLGFTATVLQEHKA